MRNTLKKELMSVERINDREKDNEKVLVVSFDLQNVIALPRANVSWIFL